MATYERDEKQPGRGPELTDGPRDWYLPVILLAGAVILVITLALLPSTTPDVTSTAPPAAFTPAPANQPEK